MMRQFQNHSSSLMVASMARSIFVAALGAWLFEVLEVPAGALIGAMLGVGILNLAGTAPAWDPPTMLKLAAFAIIGWDVGTGMTPQVLGHLRANVVPVGSIALVLIATSVALATILRSTGLDARTAMLAASPGALSQMTAMASSLRADATIVVTAHLVRIVAVIVTVPFLVRLLERR